MDNERQAPHSKMHICPKCEALNDERHLVEQGFRCVECGFEMAYTDFNPNGTIRGVFGYLKAAGEVVNDRYRIRQILGKGGFGSTYLVQDLRLQGKRRALKEIPQNLFDEQEVRLLSQLSHPSIPDITDRFSLNELIYLVLEFGGTRTLGSECHAVGGRIPLARLLPWMEQLCDALIYLHSQKPPVIHRDLKPDNVLLDDNDRVMLIDFGIAKESTGMGCTRMLARAASHGYSPPEQVLGTGTDERSDIYSFGATFYRVITGQTPPPAHERVAGKPLLSPSELVADLPPGLDALIHSMMSLNLNHRPSSVAEIKSTLSTGLSSPSAPLRDLSKTTLLMTNLDTLQAIRPIATVLAPRGHEGSAAPVRSPDAASPRRRPAWLLYAAATLGLAFVCGAGGAYLYKRSTPVEPSETVGTALQEPPATPSPLAPVQTPAAPREVSSTSPPPESQIKETVRTEPVPVNKLVSPIEGRPRRIPEPISILTIEPQSAPAASGKPGGDPAQEIRPSVNRDGAPAEPTQATQKTGGDAPLRPEAVNLPAPEAPSTPSPSLTPSTAGAGTGHGSQPAVSPASSAPSALEAFERTREKQAQGETSRQPQAAEPLIKRPNVPRRSNAPPKPADSGWTIRYIQ